MLTVVEETKAQRVKLIKEYTASRLRAKNQAKSDNKSINMDPIRCASALNNVGVHMLELKDSWGAIQIFQQAVNVMKEFTELLTNTQLPSMDDMDIPRIDPSTLVATIRSTNAIPSSPAVASATLQYEVVDVRERSNESNLINEYYIYDVALMLPADMSMQSTTACNIDMDWLLINTSVIVLFNLCIACHQFGKQNGQTAILLRALRLYELTIRMIQQRQEVSHDSFLRVVMCLTLNNMSAIHYFDLCNYHMSLSCMKYIQISLLRCDMDETALEFVHESGWTDLKLNALFACAPSAAQAA